MMRPLLLVQGIVVVLIAFLANNKNLGVLAGSPSDSHDFLGPGGPFLGGGMMKFGFGDYPGEFQSPESLPNTTSRCFGNFELLDKKVISEPIWNVHLGIRPPPPPPPCDGDKDHAHDNHDAHDAQDANGDGYDGLDDGFDGDSVPAPTTTSGSSSRKPRPPKKPIIPPPFKFTRLVWTIEPNPNETDTNTYIYSYPPHLIKATLIKDGINNSSSTITFQPAVWRHRSHHYDYFTAGFTGEAGVLIRLPRSQTLTTISYYSLYTPGSDRIQIMDSNGFPGLSTIQLNTSSQYTDLSPGQGVSLKINSGGPVSNGPNLPNSSEDSASATAAAAPAPNASNGLSLFASGSGILVQADLTHVDLVRFQNVVNSNLELKFQHVHRGFELLGGADYANINRNNLVYLEGPLAKALQPVVATEDIQVQIYDPTGQYQCYNPIDKIAECTLLMSGPAVDNLREVFPCTTLPISVDDVLFCNTDFLIQLALERNHPPGYYFDDSQSGYGCTLEGMEDQFLIPPEEDHHSGSADGTTKMSRATLPFVMTTVVASLVLYAG